jgi:hypothetical protein
MIAGAPPSAEIGAGDLGLLARRFSHHAPVVDRGILNAGNSPMLSMGERRAKIDLTPEFIGFSAIRRFDPSRPSQLILLV